MFVAANGVELAVQTFGDPEDPPVLLIGVTMLSWPAELCTSLVERHVIRYDLRDVGRSTYVDPEVLHGDDDPFFPHGNAVALATEIPGVVTLTGAGAVLPRASWPAAVEALLRHARPPCAG